MIVRSKIMAVQAGIGEELGVTSKSLEAHYLSGGNVPLVIRALIAAAKAKLTDLNFKLATAIDLAGRNVLEAVQMSVNPRVIDCPGSSMGKETLDGVAQNGIQLKVKARVTVRANLKQLIGGATEETIIARVGEGIVSAIGSAKSHLEVLASPDRISKTVLARRLDSQTAFEIVSIDIADVDVGENIGARLAGRSGRGRHARGSGERRGPPGHGGGRGAGDDRPDRGEPFQGGRGGGRGAQGDLAGIPHRQARVDGLLPAPQHSGRHGHAVFDRQGGPQHDGPKDECHGNERRNAHQDPGDPADIRCAAVGQDPGGGAACQATAAGRSALRRGPFRPTWPRNSRSLCARHASRHKGAGQQRPAQKPATPQPAMGTLAGRISEKQDANQPAAVIVEVAASTAAARASDEVEPASSEVPLTSAAGLAALLANTESVPPGNHSQRDFAPARKSGGTGRCGCSGRILDAAHLGQHGTRLPGAHSQRESASAGRAWRSSFAEYLNFRQCLLKVLYAQRPVTSVPTRCNILNCVSPLRCFKPASVTLVRIMNNVLQL